ncbi:MAG: TonB-dependent receptor [Bacteroidetes bacterium]|jgi:outer membrane cobalamin receptor|nr:TonB-dependent receptor [Bacteroidota bacterium]
MKMGAAGPGDYLPNGRPYGCISLTGTRNPLPVYHPLLLLFSVLFCSLVFSQPVQAQPDTQDIFNLGLEALSKLTVTSAAKVPQAVKELPTSVHVVSKEQLLLYGYTSLESILSDLPGFQFRNIQGMNSYVFQRGVPNQNNLTLVLIDGVQVNELNSGGFYGGGQFNINNIERIEIIYGPASETYGTNALTGIINIITRSALAPRVAANLSAGSFRSRHADLSVCQTNKEGNKGILVSAMWRTTQKTPMGGDIGDNNWTEGIENFEHDLALDIKYETPNWIVATNIQDKQASRATTEKSIGTHYLDHGSLWHIWFANQYAKYTKVWPKKGSIRAMAYYRNTTVAKNSIYAVTDTAQIGCYRPGNLMGIEAIGELFSDLKCQLSGGALLEYARFSQDFSFSSSHSAGTAPPKPNTPVAVPQYMASLFFQPRLAITSSCFLTAAIRAEYSSAYHLVFTPKLGLSYVWPRLTLRGTWANGFRGPRPWDYTHGLGNTDLQPEKMRSLEVGALWSPSHHFTCDIRAYRNFLTNLLTLDQTDAGPRMANLGQVYTNGLCVSGSYKSNPFTCFGWYAFTQHPNQLHATLPEISAHTAQAGVSVGLPKHFTGLIRAQYVGPRHNPGTIPATGSTLIEPYLLFHAALLSTQFKGVFLQVTVENIFNAQYFHPSNRSPSRYKQADRNIQLTARYSIKPKP